MKIYKYPINMFGRTELPLPKSCNIISANQQNAQMCIWAEVDTEEDTAMFGIWSITTGEEHDFDQLQHIATVMNGPLVLHVYVEV